MLIFFGRKLVGALVMLIVLSFLIFAIAVALPGSAVDLLLPANMRTVEAVAELEAELGLDQPVVVQYVNWAMGMLKGDFGNSFSDGQAVSTRIGPKAIVTFQLAIGGLMVGAIIGITAGVVSARRAGSKLDTAINVVASTVIAVPPFYAALVLAVIFSVWLQLIPFGGYVPFSDSPLEWVVRMVLPWFAIGIPGAASLSRQTRSAVLKGLDARHVQATRALGFSENAVVRGHVMRNSMLPIVTDIGFRATVVIGSSVVVENVFGLPGLGPYLISAVQTRDLPSVQAAVLVLSGAVIIVNLVVDLSYAWLNPKVRIS
ncbi:peptide/nickel transport system permease protein [Octadecabacter temperatus]|uniref:Dipeptide transport system permease protein DppB n=1 Tax=Octadecabacter temperatus TaxID=1458307 RepID=A0A0K0Y4K0_9RHOB|nr:ABC transporter permease [Octadecabacter temperatus]AKS45860.1 Dipeptide transport system permease protein DppB [Octadecabacter temperatus]SIO02184.1 peptide/nickel transport system permease protein [Octadecabacter temperatus]